MRVFMSSCLVMAMAAGGCASTGAALDQTAEPAAGAAYDVLAGHEGRTQVGQLVMENIPEIPADVRARLQQYQNTRGASFSDWTGEGGMLISTRFAEVAQIHEVAAPLGARTQITFYDEPVRGADVAPGGGRFIFTKDTGGDEFFQGYLFDGGTSFSFTEPGTRNGALAWSDTGQQVAWYRSTADDPDWDILIAEPDAPQSLEVVLEGEGAMAPVDWSAEGDKLLVGKYVSIAKSHVYVLDLNSGELTELRGDLDVSWSPIAFTADGEGVLAVTDWDSEFRRLVEVDIATGAIEVLSPDHGWDVDSIAVSEDGAAAVYALNAGGLSEVYVMDLATGAVRPGPDLPVGIAGGFGFSPDGRQVGFTFNSHMGPSDAWSFDIQTKALTRWTQSEVGGLDPATFVEPELVVYAQNDGHDIPAFVYTPKGEGPHPVIVLIHGGPEAQYRPGFSSTIQYWVNELGAAVIAPNVRGSAGYGKTYVGLDNGLNRKRSVEDIGSLLDWIGGQQDLDPDRVVVYGGSYGGYMVLASMIDYGDRLAGGVNIVGISDFKTFLENTMGYRRDLRRAEYGDERDPEIAAFFDAISPLKNADQIDKPLFVIQGFNDPRVPYTEAEQILAAARANGVEPWFLMAMDEGHGFAKKANRDFMSEAVTLFLKDVLALE